MDGIVDLLEWRRRRAAEKPREEAAWSNGDPSDAPNPEIVTRLERAIDRLTPLVTRTLEAGEPLRPRVETELLAIMGELTVGLVGEAAGRAERLVRKLESAG